MPRLTEVASGYGRGIPIGVDVLEEYAAELNRGHLARQARWHWFVNKRRHDDGTVERYLDKQEQAFVRTPWIMQEGEAEATHTVVAEMIERGVEQHEFNEMVRRGIISRKVDELLRLTEIAA